MAPELRKASEGIRDSNYCCWGFLEKSNNCFGDMGPKKGDRTPTKMTGAIPDASYLGEKYDVVVEGVNDSPQKDEVSMEVRMAEIAQNQEFARRTEKLVAALDEKNRELEKLAVVVESITPLPGMDPEKYLLLASGDEDAPDFRDGKIVALAKKTRKLTEALRKEKGLATKLMRENESLEKRCAQIEEDKATVVAQMQDRRPVSSEETEVMMEELRKLRKDNKASSKTIDELKRKVHEKEQRMKAMERTLVKELGDAVDMEKVRKPSSVQSSFVSLLVLFLRLILTLVVSLTLTF